MTGAAGWPTVAAMRARLAAPLLAALAALFAACGGDASTCTGTLSGAVTGAFTCSLQASYANNGVLTVNTSTGPAGLRDISLAFRTAQPFTARTYQVADLQSLTGQVVHAAHSVFQVANMPPKGSATLVIGAVDDSQSTVQEAHYGLSGSIDATLVDSTGLTADTVVVHVDF